MEMVANGLAVLDLHTLALQAAARADRQDEQVREKREAETRKHSILDLAGALNRVVGMETGHTFTEETLADLPGLTLNDGHRHAVVLDGCVYWTSQRDREMLCVAPLCASCGGDVDFRQRMLIDTLASLGRYYRATDERQRRFGDPLCEACRWAAEQAACELAQSDQSQQDPAPPDQTPETFLIALLESLGFQRG